MTRLKRIDLVCSSGWSLCTAVSHSNVSAPGSEATPPSAALTVKRTVDSLLHETADRQSIQQE